MLVRIRVHFKQSFEQATWPKRTSGDLMTDLGKVPAKGQNIRTTMDYPPPMMDKIEALMGFKSFRTPKLGGSG